LKKRLSTDMMPKSETL